MDLEKISRKAEKVGLIIVNSIWTVFLKTKTASSKAISPKLKPKPANDTF